MSSKERLRRSSLLCSTLADDSEVGLSGASAAGTCALQHSSQISGVSAEP